MLTRHLALLLCVGLTTLSLLASSCSSSESSTKLVVLMDTDYPVPTEVDRIRARVLKVSEDGEGETETWSKVYPLSSDAESGPGLYSLPATFAVLPADGDMARTVAIELEALPRLGESATEGGTDEPLVVSRAETGFVPGESRLLRMWLFRDCAGVACPQDETCGCADVECSFLACTAQFVEPQSLEPIENASLLPADPTIPSHGCQAPLTLCGDECVDTTSNPSYCGDCETVCQSRQVCADSVCIDLADCRNEVLVCSGFSYCDQDTGQCLRGCDTDTQCGSSETCDTSIHECVCKEEFELCADLCVDTETDPRFCGDCGTACASGEVCQESSCIDLGNCVTNGIGCTGFTYCDQDTGDCLAGCERNEQCGAANERCDIESHACVCEPSFERCPPTGGSCVDTQTDSEHCGDCGIACGVDELCQAGECFDPNDCRSNGIGCTGFTYCDQNTGDCRPGCDRNAQCPRANERCNVSLHACVCDPGFNRCGVECVSLQTDERNCGSCGNVCGAGEVCQAGACFDPNDCRTNGVGCSGFTYCDQSTGECLPGCDRDAQCSAANERCDVTSHTCVCDPGFSRCGGACVNTDTDESNCGSCGSECLGGNLCCGGGCADTATDESNCGGCGNVCSGGNLCCGGGCADTDTDESNCGGCGNVCRGGDLCCGGGCADTATDEANCGGCGIICGSGEVCQAGQCEDPNDCRRPGNSCSGFTYCDQNTGDCLPGCDSDTQCPRANDSCDTTSHACVCDSGFVDCGECVDTQTDPGNCGGCGNACDLGLGEFCDAGTCTTPPVASPPGDE